MERFSELKKKSFRWAKNKRPLCFFTKIIATTWSTHKIIPVPIALEKNNDDGGKRGNFVNKPRQ